MPYGRRVIWSRCELLTEWLYYNSRLFTWRYLVRVWRADCRITFFITHTYNRRSTHAPAWNGFLSETDRLQSVIKKAKQFGYLPSSFCNFGELCADADEKLFFSVRYNVLRQLLPSVKTTSYNLRARSHNFTLPGNLTNLGSKNFINRMLFANAY